ncbi:MAG: Fic family protein [Erysipelotrichaceae bacterium]|jgi:Fic family protein|nr:Fic family protein [Erysipelotrichaceae bacterium]
MIKVKLDSGILNSILEIEKNKNSLDLVKIPINLSNKFIKNTKKRSSYASNKIEGNPLTYEQADAAIEAKNRHFLKPEQEIRNYYLALELLEKKLENKEPLSLKLLLEVQKQICEGEPKEKIGLRGAMPPGVLFAVWNDDGTPAYIPPEYSEVPILLDELLKYINDSDDHPLIKAAVIHYQLVTIHPFEDGNGRTARIISSYYLSLNGYGFKNVGSLEEYMSYNIDEYYDSLQMGLPILYYDGRNNPPHGEIWIKYYLKIFSLYASKVLSIALEESNDNKQERLSHLSKKVKDFLNYLEKNNVLSFAPIDLANKLKVTNRTIINWCSELVNNGYLRPVIVNKRIRHYELIK